MASSCTDVRTRLLAEILPAGEARALRTISGAGADAVHLQGCADCRDALERAERNVRALGDLARHTAPDILEDVVRGVFDPEQLALRAVAVLGGLERVDAPADLDGSVVYAIHAGYRQDRATASLVGLARRSAPSELEERVLIEPSQAPDVLDRLVAEELADPAKAMTRRFTGRLTRLRTPAALDQRIEETISETRENPSVQTLHPRRFAPLAAAAGLLVLLWAGQSLLQQPVEPEYSFQVQRVESVHELGAAARSLISGVGGGLLDASSDHGTGGPR